jgi:DNA-binding CsgD family transcriptional regulator
VLTRAATTNAATPTTTARTISTQNRPRRHCDHEVTRTTCQVADATSASQQLHRVLDLSISRQHQDGGIRQFLTDHPGLKSRVADVEEFLDALQRVARGGSVVDPALVQELVSARRREDPLAALSAREREVLALMAEGRSNAGISRRLFVTGGTVEKHVSSILTKLNLHDADDDHRRVLAVITFLKAR